MIVPSRYLDIFLIEVSWWLVILKRDLFYRLNEKTWRKGGSARYKNKATVRI